MPRTAQNLTRGIQPHFLSRLIEVDAEETPGFTLLPKGQALKNPIAQAPIDNKDSAAKTGRLDNAPTDGATSQDNYRILESWNHMLDELVSVGKKADNLVDQAGIGSGKQYIRALEKKMSAIKTAADQIICDSEEMVAEGTGGSGSETRGLFAWCAKGAQSVKPVDKLYRTPADQISVVNADELYEETVQGLINAHFDNTGRSGNFTALCGIKLKQRMSNWSILSDANATNSYIRRFTGDQSKEAKILTAMVNVLECDGGKVEVHKSRNLLWSRSPSTRGTYSAHSMIAWHQGCAEMRPGWLPTHEPLGKRGPGKEGSINMDFAVCADPTGLIKYVPAALS